MGSSAEPTVVARIDVLSMEMASVISSTMRGGASFGEMFFFVAVGGADVRNCGNIF